MSLVEVMVGIVIGMIGIVIIFEALASFEARRYSTSGSADSQAIGAISLHALERDIRQAGYGFNQATLMGCTVSAVDTARPAPAYTFQLAPIVITQGAGGAPDTLATLYGSGSLLVTTQTFSASTATSKQMQSRAGVQAGDRVIVTGAGPLCAMVEVTATNNADGVSITHALGNYVNAAGTTVAARYNNPAVTFSSGNIYNLGSAPQRVIWSINGFKTLIRTNDLTYGDANGDGVNDFLEVGDNIIDLQADYGYDANANNRVESTEWTTVAPVNWGQVLAIRVALLVRNSQYEKTQITTAAPTWLGGTFTMRNVDGTTDTNPSNDKNWRNYRYRVYQTIIPLRNQIWGTAP